MEEKNKDSIIIASRNFIALFILSVLGLLLMFAIVKMPTSGINTAQSTAPLSLLGAFSLLFLITGILLKKRNKKGVLLGWVLVTFMAISTIYNFIEGFQIGDVVAALIVIYLALSLKKAHSKFKSLQTL